MPLGAYVEEKLRLRGPLYSLDVECVAVGKTHLSEDYSPVKFALLDGDCRTVCCQYIKPDKPIVSYLTPLTGIQEKDMKDAISMAEAAKVLKRNLPTDAVLVGQNIGSDIAGMNLKQGVDFADSIDLSEVFKGYNARYGNTSYHSLMHEARIILRLSHLDSGASHDPANDAKLSIQLWIKVQTSPHSLDQMRRELIANRPNPSVAKRLGYQYEGVCMAGFMPSKCICGKPTQRTGR